MCVCFLEGWIERGGGRGGQDDEKMIPRGESSTAGWGFTSLAPVLHVSSHRSTQVGPKLV